VRDLTRGPARPALRLLGRDERGAVGVLVAVLFAGGVLLGLGAMVIDVGQLYQERAELQNGADAAALAVAKSCATGVCSASGALTTAGTYASENASVLTGGTEAASVCGSGAGDTLTACGTPGTAMTSCPPNPTGTNYVDVSTSTKTSGGATVIAPVFAGELLGNGSYAGTTVQACAQAEWGGAPSNTLSTAFTISACEWSAATTNGTVYAQAPPYPPDTTPSSTLDQVIKFRSGSGTGCAAYPAPDDAVSKFGWVAETGGCTLQLTGTGVTTYGVLNSGSSSSPDCNTPLYDDAQDKTLINVPVYTSVTGSGASAVYNLLGFAAFVVTGYNIPGSTFNKYTDWLKSSNQCTGTTYCINGYFVSQLLTGDGTFGTALGLNMIKLTG
jgi:Flp pilus assembly protein TadG